MYAGQITRLRPSLHRSIATLHIIIVVTFTDEFFEHLEVDFLSAKMSRDLIGESIIKI